MTVCFSIIELKGLMGETGGLESKRNQSDHVLSREFTSEPLGCCYNIPPRRAISKLTYLFIIYFMHFRKPTDDICVSDQSRRAFYVEVFKVSSESSQTLVIFIVREL